MTPSISVVVRTIGSPQLQHALESLVQQTQRDFEVVVVDMSGGRAAEALRRAEPLVPALVHLQPRRRLPRPAALNAGVAAATASRIAVLDEDCVYDPGHLAMLVAALDASGADYVYSGVRHATYSPDGELISRRDVAIPFARERLLMGNFIYATGSSYSKSIWRRVGGYDERFIVFEDWDFLLRVAGAGRIEHIALVSGESRKFTGREGVSNFELDVAAARRCHAGVYWKRRRQFHGDLLGELKVVWADHCRRRTPVRRGLWERSLGGWRLEALRDLVAWWIASSWRARR